MLLANPLGYLPAVIYLTMLSIPMGTRRKDIVHAAGLLVGVSVHWVLSGWGSVAFSVVAAAVIWVGLVMFGALSRTTTFGIPIALASLPVFGWVAFIPGVLLALAQSVWTLTKVKGAAHVADISKGTLATLATGAADAARLRMPRLMLPLPNGATVLAVPMPWLLAVGVALTALAAALA